MAKEINAIVRQYAYTNGGDYQGTWNKLYKFYNKVAHLNIKRRAHNKKIRPIEMVAKLNDLDLLKDLAVILFVA